MASDAGTPEQAWSAFVDGLRAAGDRLAAETAALDDAERADGYRALLRALTGQLGRFEVDRERPELVAFNGWRERFFMDNPDVRYWVADVRDDRWYRITGSTGDACHQSVTVYAGTGGIEATASARLDTDSTEVDADGRFEITLVPEGAEGSEGAGGPDESVAPGTGPGNQLVLPPGATAVWVRQFHHDVTSEQEGWCGIDPVDEPAVPPAIDGPRFGRHLARLGTTMEFLPGAFAAAARHDHDHPNEARHWSEMAGGAAYTEPGIHYLRGAWLLDPGEALVLEGPVVGCLHWNVVLYSRFLNSLDHRHRPVSCTGATATVRDGRYRFVLAAQDPGGEGDWLDTEGRPFGLFVFRWLRAARPPELPAVWRGRVDDLGGRP